MRKPLCDLKLAGKCCENVGYCWQPAVILNPVYPGPISSLMMVSTVLANIRGMPPLVFNIYDLYGVRIVFHIWFSQAQSWHNACTA